MTMLIAWVVSALHTFEIRLVNPNIEITSEFCTNNNMAMRSSDIIEMAVITASVIKRDDLVLLP